MSDCIDKPLAEPNYSVFEQSMTMNEAMDFCSELGGTLFEPRSSHITRGKVKDLALEALGHLDDPAIWFGITDEDSEGTFKFLSLESSDSIVWNDWEPGEPNNMNEFEHCVVMKPKTGTWFDYSCHDLKYPVCEFCSSKLFSLDELPLSISIEYF